MPVFKKGRTVMQNVGTRMTKNRRGRCVHPRSWIKARKMNRTGSVMPKRVRVSVVVREGVLVDGGCNAAAWRAVDNLETRTEPTEPGNPFKPVSIVNTHTFKRRFVWTHHRSR